MTDAPRRRPSRLRKAASQLGVAVGLLVLAELALRAAGVAPTADTEDPYVGFAGTPLYVDAGNGFVETAANKLSRFNAQRFAAEKPPGTFRIFTLGGSTTYGRPYDDRSSFSAWLRELLPLADPDRDFEVINAGGISYASYRVAALMEELLRYDPDLFIVYSGHNEFLEQRTYANLVDTPEALLQVGSWLSRTSLYTAGRGALRALAGQETTGTGEARFELTEDVTTRLDNAFGPSDYQRDDEGAARILEHYRFNLNRMVTLARSAGVGLIFVIPGSSLADCTPFKSEFSASTGPERRARIGTLLDEATVAMTGAGGPEQALPLLHEAVALDPRYALSQYRLGEALVATERYEPARAAFLAARDEDVCPLRAPSAFETAVEDVAHQRSVPCLDWRLTADSRATLCAGGCVNPMPAAETYMDHVHLAPDAHQQLGLELLGMLIDQGLVDAAPGWDDSDALDDIEARMNARVDREARGRALKNLAKVLGWAGKTEEANRLALQSQQLLGTGDAETHFLLGTHATEAGRWSEAASHYGQAVALDPHYGEAWLNRGQALLRSQGGTPDPQQAIALLESATRAVELMPDHAPAWELRGLVLSELGNHDEAVTAFEHALGLRPDDAGTLNNLGLALLRADRPTEARDRFEQAVAADPDYARGWYNLGLVRAALGETDGAVTALRNAVRLDPENARARSRLAQLSGEG